MAGSFSSGDTTRESASREAGGLSGQGPESQNAGGRDKDPSDRNGPRSKLGGGGLRLPPEYADFILADGRRLEDVLGKGFFKPFKKDPAREAALAQRRRQAGRLNQTRSILTGAQGVAGAARTASSELSGG